MDMLRRLGIAAFYMALVVIGFSAGLCVKVFLSRGQPVIHGGGELLLLLAIPASVFTGYVQGKKSRRDNSDGKQIGTGSHTGNSN
ncbi:hypothetical protein [Candidatus Soleaferrea massiliensis]|uniref:hypothetical protein n=1 Tax=Candidatus Soleaferrea massiliensis TaxID=1470354 RepID=UPI000590DA8A|nr:hypothetical protein [Candidatus Soleaferrea massiliensis]